MKTISTTICVLSFLLATTVSSAQSKSYRMYDVFANKDGITHFSFSKNMIDAIDLNLGENDNDKQVTGDLHEIRFMSYNPEKGSLSAADFTEKSIAFLSKSAYKKYEGADDDDDAEIWLLGGKKKFSECHLFIKNHNENGNRMVVSFYGDFTVNDLKRLKKTSKNF